MDELPPWPMPERTVWTDKCYEAIGRALAYATDYECNARTLALLLRVKLPEEGFDPSDLDQVNALALELCKRPLKRHLDAGATRLGLPDEGRSALSDARDARNYLAHDICKGIEHQANDDMGRTRFKERLSEDIRKIAVANAIVGHLLRALTHEPLPQGDFLDRYCADVIHWVCESYDDEP